MNNNLEGVSIISINWEALGAKLAIMTTDEQIPFFKGFVDEMLKYETHFSRETQLTAIIVDGKFNEKQQEIFETLAYRE